MTTSRKDSARSAPDVAPGSGAIDAWQMLLGVAQATTLVPAQPRAAPRSIPFTLITGFLGAGKTTLVNRLLTGQHGVRLAVLVNDFGAINIDASLIRRRDGEMLSLANGCACCSIAGNLSRALLDLTERDDPPEAVLLEASGVAEPNSIAQVALSNPALRLDAVVTVLDGETVRRHAADEHYGGIVIRQISSADVAIVNKRDLISDHESLSLRTWLGDIHPRCRIVESVHGNVPIETVFGLGIHDEDRDGRAASGRVAHAHNFNSWSLVADESLDPSRLLAMVPALPTGIIRAKGILCLADDPQHRYVFQMVGDRWTLDRGEPWKPSDPRRSTLVLIGLEGCTDEADLERRFAACCSGAGGARIS